MILWAFKLISNNTWYYCWQDYLHIYHCFLCEVLISARQCHQHLKQKKKDKMQCSMSAAVLTLHFYMAVVEWCLAFHSANVCFFSSLASSLQSLSHTKEFISIPYTCRKMYLYSLKNICYCFPLLRNANHSNLEIVMYFKPFQSWVNSSLDNMAIFFHTFLSHVTTVAM